MGTCAIQLCINCICLEMQTKNQFKTDLTTKYTKFTQFLPFINNVLFTNLMKSVQKQTR